VLLCADTAGTLACPSCGSGRLARWGHGRERVVRLRDGKAAQLRPDRGRCRACAATHILLPAWCAPRRADAIEVIGTAAAAAAAGMGHRPIAAALGVPSGTVRGWLRRLRAQADLLRCYAMGELAAIGGFTPALPDQAASPLGAALNAVAACVHAARRLAPAGPPWPLIGRFGLARYLAPVPVG